MLPKGKHGSRTVELSGGPVEVHSLTVTQSHIAARLQDEERAVASISFACRVDKEAARSWLAEAPAGDGVKLLNAIAEVSGLVEGASFQQ